MWWKLGVTHRTAALQDATGIAADNTAQKTEEGKAAAAVKKVPDPSYSHLPITAILNRYQAVRCGCVSITLAASACCIRTG